MKQQSVMKQWVYRVLCVFMGAMFLIGCKSSQAPHGKLESVSMYATNHMPYNITEFYVNDYWGGGSSALNKGGSIVCCSYLPQKWYEGLTAKVRWTHSQAIKDVRGNPIGETVWYEYDAPVLPYQSLQDIVVHFFPDHTAKIVVLSAENVSHPPIADPVRPNGWKNNPVEYYCKVVKLNGMSEQRCQQLTHESYYGSSNHQ